MNPETARIFLELAEGAEDEELLDVLETKAFDLRSFFLQQAVVPLLYESRIVRLRKLQLAYETLGGELLHSTVQLPDIPSATKWTLIDLLEVHAAYLAACRSQMARTLFPEPLIELAQRMIAMQDQYEVLFMDLTAEMGFTNDEQVKQSDQLDLGPVLHVLRAKGPKALENEIAKERQRINLKYQN